MLQRLAEFRYGAIGLASATDLVLQTTPEYVRRYLSDECPATFWPFGSDPARVDTMVKATERDYGEWCKRAK